MLAAAVSLTTIGPAAEPDDTPFQDQVSVGYVYVPVVVRSPSGYVKDLKARDFRLLVDGRPATFETFETGATAPASVVVLQDLSGSMANGGKLAASKDAVRYLLNQARYGDQFALAWFAGDIREIDVPFTSDLAAVRQALDSWEAYGTTALQNAVAWLPKLAADCSAMTCAALLITDGVDNASTIDADQARELVRQAELPVYVLGLSAGDDSTGDEGEIERFAEVLELLATLTGGTYHELRGADELEKATAKVLEALRHQYVLGFSTGETGRARDHRLEVEIAGRRRRALAFRRTYFGLDPEAAPAPVERR